MEDPTIKSVVRENNQYVAAIHVLGMLFFLNKETEERSDLFMGEDYSEVNEASPEKFNFMAEKALNESL